MDVCSGQKNRKNLGGIGVMLLSIVTESGFTKQLAGDCDDLTFVLQSLTVQSKEEEMKR